MENYFLKNWLIFGEAVIYYIFYTEGAPPKAYLPLEVLLWLVEPGFINLIEDTLNKKFGIRIFTSIADTAEHSMIVILCTSHNNTYAKMLLADFFFFFKK